MESEEAEWQTAQTKIRGQADVEDQDGYDAMEYNDEVTDEENDEGEVDEDNDVIPGCYVRDIGIDGLALKPLDLD
jgi:hypothetical protein